MWLVKYVEIKNKANVIWRTYKGKSEQQVRAIANNMKGYMWVRMTQVDQHLN